MSLIGNLLWIVLGGGLLLCFWFLLGGLVLCLTVVGIPFGLQCFKLAGLALFPFGKQILPAESRGGCLTTAMNLVWLLFGGIWLALTHFIFALLLTLSIIGIPFAVQHMKLVALALSPFGKRVV